MKEGVGAQAGEVCRCSGAHAPGRSERPNKGNEEIPEHYLLLEKAGNADFAIDIRANFATIAIAHILAYYLDRLCIAIEQLADELGEANRLRSQVMEGI